MDQKPTISSLQNTRVKQTVKLRKHSYRRQTGLMLVEGSREIKCALAAHWQPVSLFTCPDFFSNKTETRVIDLIAKTGAEIFLCAPQVFNKMVYRDCSEGLLAVFKQTHRNLDDLALSPNPFLLIVESLEKPGNLGAILRSADAAGVEAVIVCDSETDIYNPNIVRASIGTLFSVPVYTETAPATLAWLEKHNIAALVATSHASLAYTAAALTGRIALVLGSEQAGVSQTWLKAAGTQIRIPMQGQAGSLNVAAAAAVLIFEACRQRNQSKAGT